MNNARLVNFKEKEDYVQLTLDPKHVKNNYDFILFMEGVPAKLVKDKELVQFNFTPVSRETKFTLKIFDENYALVLKHEFSYSSNSFRKILEKDIERTSGSIYISSSDEFYIQVNGEKLFKSFTVESLESNPLIYNSKIRVEHLFDDTIDKMCICFVNESQENLNIRLIPKGRWYDAAISNSENKSLTFNSTIDFTLSKKPKKADSLTVGATSTLTLNWFEKGSDEYSSTVLLIDRETDTILQSAKDLFSLVSDSSLSFSFLSALKSGENSFRVQNKTNEVKHLKIVTADRGDKCFDFFQNDHENKTLSILKKGKITTLTFTLTTKNHECKCHRFNRKQEYSLKDTSYIHLLINGKEYVSSEVFENLEEGLNSIIEDNDLYDVVRYDGNSFYNMSDECLTITLKSKSNNSVVFIEESLDLCSNRKH